MYPPNLKSVALPVSEIRGGSWVANPQSGGRGGEAIGLGDGLFKRALMGSYIDPGTVVVRHRCRR